MNKRTRSSSARLVLIIEILRKLFPILPLLGSTAKWNVLFRLTHQALFPLVLATAWSLHGAGSSVSYYQNVYETEYQNNKVTYDELMRSNWGPTLYYVETPFQATLSVWDATRDAKYVERALLWAETLVSTATLVDINGRKNWLGTALTRYSPTPIAALLEDQHVAIGLARLARIILTDTTLKTTWGARATAIYNFTRDHLLNKDLYSRAGYEWYTLNVRQTDDLMSDKSAMVMRILLDMMQASSALGNNDNTTYGYRSLLYELAQGFKDHLNGTPRFTSFGGGLIFDYGKSDWEPPYPQPDTAHGNRYPDALVELYRNGIVFDSSYVTGLANLLTKVIWDQSLTSPRFANFIDGSNTTFMDRTAWYNGLIYNGWVKLAEFDTQAFMVMDATLKAILAGTTNPSLSYNGSIWGRIALAGHLAKAAAAQTSAPPPSDSPPPASGAASSFVTGKNLGTLRNDYSCWAGMKFTVGASPLIVSSLGRVFASGNSLSHVVKLVKASSGIDVINGSVSLYMGGGTPGEFKYASLASPVTLSANTSYYLVSQENQGGDQWYNCDSTVTTSNAASCDGFVYGDPNWYAYAVPGRLYGPVDFKFTSSSNSGQVDSSPPPVSDDPPPATQTESSFVAGKVLGTLRNDYTCWPGMRFTIGPSPLTVTSLGRVFASGNTATHTVKLVRASNGTDVSNGSVSIPMAGGILGQFLYGSLASPVTLSANTSYYLVSQETQGGDQWYDCNGSVTTTSVGTCDGFVFADPGWNVYLYPGRVYVPVDFKYLK